MAGAFRCAAALVLVHVLIVAPARAADAPKSRAETEKAEALAILKRTSDFIGSQQQFRFDAEIGYDVVQQSGQKLEFGGARKVLVRRPDHARVEVLRRHGEEQTLIFDGEKIWVDLPAENAYASVAKAGTIDEVLDYLTEDLGIPAPLAEFLSADFYSAAAPQIRSGFLVGEEIIEGAACQHLAFRGDDLDFQIWIQKGERPLPSRLVITYHGAEGAPQFWARLHHWDLAAAAPDSAFQFSPAKGAERLPFTPRKVEKLEEGGDR